MPVSLQCIPILIFIKADIQLGNQKKSKAKSSRKVEKLRDRFQDSGSDGDPNPAAYAVRGRSKNMPIQQRTSDAASAVGLGPYMDCVQEFLARINNFQSAFEEIPVALEHMKDTLAQHRDEVERVNDIVDQNMKLREEVAVQVVEMESCKRTLNMMARDNDAGTKALEEQKIGLEEQQKELALEKEAVQREASRIKEESEGILNREMKALEQRAQQHEKSLATSSEVRVRDALRKSDEEKSDLLGQVQAAKKQIDDLKVNIKTLEDEKNEALQSLSESKRLKESFDRENKQLQESIHAINRMFTCGTNDAAD